MAQHKEKWQGFVNAGMKLDYAQGGKFLEQLIVLLVPQEGLYMSGVCDSCSLKTCFVFVNPQRPKCGASSQATGQRDACVTCPCTSNIVAARLAPPHMCTAVLVIGFTSHFNFPNNRTSAL